MPGNPNPRIDHLIATRFKPGNPGGPGRNRKRPMSEAADDRVRSPLEQKFRLRFKEAGLTVPREATVADGIILALSMKALAGDVAAAKELREQIEGKSKIRVEVEDNTKRTPRLVVVFEGKQVDPLNPTKMIEDSRTIDMSTVSETVSEAVVADVVQEAIEQESDEDDRN